MKEHLSRKRNRLVGYDYSQQSLYYVTLCTKDRKKLFGSLIDDVRSELNPLTVIVGVDAHIDPPVLGFNQYINLSDCGKTADKYMRTISGLDCYCIMPDHIHMIINLNSHQNGSMWASTTTKNLSQIIKSFKILVTKEIGSSIWQRSFYDHIIRDYNDYQIRFNYIENNALNWLDKHQA